MLYALRTNRHPPKSGGLSAMRTFLTSLGLERYCKAFEDAEVDLSAVDVMEESDYAELGVAKVSATLALLGRSEEAFCFSLPSLEGGRV